MFVHCFGDLPRCRQGRVLGPAVPVGSVNRSLPSQGADDSVSGLADILGAEPTPELVATMDEQFRLHIEILDDDLL